ncbi:hypothetical protein [Roseobacter sinensis]|uniref:Uncharacterized protein n=1 Tax=Roseobacter sinensis TaxID=2931391 RepID=A0ABT3BJY3_9RHOB|nr:hypothetical protein [Roseobacter sp. WL0113]MCV3273871.1 hypothetical protein [Roseobacter sp. WL0113]
MDTLTDTILAVLMIGNTHYVDIGAASDAVIFYETEKTAHMTLPGEGALVGDMTVYTDGYHVAWQGGPAGDWKIGHEAGVFTYTGPDGEAAGTITKIVPGNPEGY